MYGRHPAMLANTILNSYYTPYSTPYLYNSLGGPFGAMSPLAHNYISPMMHHWMNPVTNPIFNPFGAYNPKESLIKSVEHPNQLEG